MEAPQLAAARARHERDDFYSRNAGASGLMGVPQHFGAAGTCLLASL